jgi:hypothetical protein
VEVVAEHRHQPPEQLAAAEVQVVFFKDQRL